MDSIRSVLVLFFLLSTAALFAACGGGGGGGVILPPDVAEPVRLSTSVQGSQADVDTAYNSSGEGVAVWVTYSQNFTGRLLYAVYNGADWSSPVSLGKTDSLPSVASDGTGFMVVWQRNGNIYGTVYNGAGWEPESEIESTYYSAQDPVVASDGAGYAAIWRQYHQSSTNGSFAFRLFSNFYNGSAWGDAAAPVKVEGLEDEYGASGYALMLVSNGTGYAAAWRNEDSSGFSSIYAALTNSTGWEPEVLLSNSTVGSQDVVAASNGTGYAVGWTDRETPYNQYASIYNGLGWSTYEPVENLASYTYTSAMVSNGTGYAFAFVGMSGSNVPNLYTAMHDGSAWSAPEGFETLNNSWSYRPALTSNGSGYAAVWSMWDGFAYSAYTNIYENGSWGDPNNPVLVESGAGKVSSDRGSMAWDGTGYVAFWAQESAGSDQIFTSSFDGASWSTEANLSSGNYLSNARGPVVATNDSGSTMTAWVQYEGERRYLYSRLFNGTAWEDAGRIGWSLNADKPAIATNGSDFMLVHAGTGLYARLYNGTAWEPEVPLESIITPSSNPVIASYGDRYAAVWSQYNYGIGGWDIYANVYNGTAWQDPGTITPLEISNTVGWYADIATNGSSFMAAWHQHDGVEYSIYYSYYNGSAWEPAGLVESMPGSSALPKLASDGSGYAITWKTSNGVYAAMYNGNGWDAEMRVDSNSGAAQEPDIASNGTGYAVTWKRGTGIYASLYNGAGWDPEAAVSSLLNSAAYPAIASDGSGYAVVWREYDPVSSAYNLYLNKHNGSWGAASPVGGSSTGLTADPVIVYSGGMYASVWTQSSAEDPFVDSIWGYLDF